jgi:hypothetical protein
MVEEKVRLSACQIKVSVATDCGGLKHAKPEAAKLNIKNAGDIRAVSTFVHIIDINLTEWNSMKCYCQFMYGNDW